MDTTVKPLFSCRIGFYMFRGDPLVGSLKTIKAEYKISWPLGKLALYRDHLNVGSILKSFDIGYNDLEGIKRLILGRVQILHSDPETFDAIYLQAPGLWTRLGRALQRHRLPISIL